MMQNIPSIFLSYQIFSLHLYVYFSSFFFVCYFWPIVTSRVSSKRYRSTRAYFIPFFTRSVRLLLCIGNIVFLFLPTFYFYISRSWLTPSRLHAVPLSFLRLSVNQAARSARGDTTVSLFAKRIGVCGDSQRVSPGRRITIGDLAIHGGLLLTSPEGRTSVFRCGFLR